MKPNLSICITALNDTAELNNTIQSIRDTVPGDVEIVAVDDASEVPAFVTDKRVRLHRQPFRRGVGPARHKAAELATGDTLLFLDAHMRFTQGWYEATLDRIGDPMTVWCGTCLGLGYGTMDVLCPKGIYQGAYLLCYSEATGEVFEGKWNGDLPHTDSPITCLMGASYFVPKKLFFDVGGLDCLRFWGSDEPYLSSKVLLAGGKIMLSKDIRIGHEFRDKNSFATPNYVPVYNKLRCIYELFDFQTAQFLAEKLSGHPAYAEARAEVIKAFGAIAEARKRNESVFKHDMRSMCDLHKISYPMP